MEDIITREFYYNNAKRDLSFLKGLSLFCPPNLDIFFKYYDDACNKEILHWIYWKSIEIFQESPKRKIVTIPHRNEEDCIEILDFLLDINKYHDIICYQNILISLMKKNFTEAFFFFLHHVPPSIVTHKTILNTFL